MSPTSRDGTNLSPYSLFDDRLVGIDMSAGVSGPVLLSLLWVRESREGVENPNIGCNRCFRRREVSSESCCEARRRFPKGEFLSPDILFLQVEAQQKKTLTVNLSFCAILWTVLVFVY